MQYSLEANKQANKKANKNSLTNMHDHESNRGSGGGASSA